MNSYLTSIIKQFEYYKSLGDETIARIDEDMIHWSPNNTSNNLCILVKHLSGNMLSRWTNLLTEDGEKEWRNRDDEFEDTIQSKHELEVTWNKGWNCLFETIRNLEEQDLSTIIYIRNGGHTVVEAINRQLCHYAYHVGQMVYLGKLIKNEKWESLSIPQGASSIYNKKKFKQDRDKRHFTDDL